MRRVILFAAAMVAVLGSFGLASAAEVATVVDTTSRAYIALAAGLAIGIGALGAALGQGRMAAAAMESIGRNPNAADRIVQLPMILGLASSKPWRFTRSLSRSSCKARYRRRHLAGEKGRGNNSSPFFNLTANLRRADGLACSGGAPRGCEAYTASGKKCL